jgi:protease II
MTVTLPRARVSPETNTVGGITFDDPYQRLEAPTEETTRWQLAQDEAAREYIRAWPGWPVLRLDLNEIPHTKPIQLGGLAFSPDKRLMSYSILEGGAERPRIRIVDRTSGAVLMPRFTHDGRFLMVMGGLVQSRPYYLLDTKDPDGPFVPFLKDVAGKFKGDIVGDQYICVTDDGAPRGRVISIPLQTPADRSSWRQLVPAARIDGLSIKRMWATSKDGTRVPADVVHRGPLDMSRPHPTLVHAYGGFNMALMPAYLGHLERFVAAGGVYVTAHLRGGGEYGTEWWRQGRMAAKQNVFDDLFAVCEQLIGDGITRPDLLAFQGGSNGGLVAGVAITQRPDLFRAVVAQVPLLDLLRAGRFALVMEFGDPQNPANAQVLAAYSPYHNVREASYPAVLLDAGENDPRRPAWHSRKMAARLQAANLSEHPILLRVWKDSGHVGGNKSTLIDQSADWLAFVMQELGMELPSA